METTPRAPETDQLVAALINWFDFLDGVVTHMETYAAVPPTPQSIVSVLVELLGNTLDPVAQARGVAPIGGAAALVDALTEHARHELLMVSPDLDVRRERRVRHHGDARSNRAQRRAARRRK